MNSWMDGEPAPDFPEYALERPPRVALLIDSLAGGGAERVVCELAAGLARRGHGTYVYCLKRPDCDTRDLTNAGVTVRAAESFGRDFGLAKRLRRWMRADAIQVVHAHSSAAYCWALAAAKPLRLPVILTRHGAHLGRRNFYPRWADRLIGLADCVTLVAEEMRAALPSRRTARRAIFLPNGLDRAPIRPTAARGELERLCGFPLTGPTVLSVGTICPEKDTLTLVEAFALTRTTLPEAKLVIAGGERGAEYAREVRGRIERLELTEHVHLLGPIEDAWRLMAGADVFCQSSRTEAMPLAILEAMSQEVPIVATAVGDVGRLNQDIETHTPTVLRHDETALLVPPNRPRLLADALCIALNDPAAARERAEKAFTDYQEHYTLNRMVGRYQSVYADCTSQRRSDAATTRKPVVTMLGPAAPLIGGMVTSIGLLLRSPLREQFELHRLGTTVDPERGALPDQARGWRRACGRVAALGRHVRALCSLAAFLVRRRVSILHIHTCSYFTFYRNLLDLAVAKLLRCKVILHIRGNLFDRYCRESGRLGRWLIRHGLESADAVIVLSHGWQDALKPFAGRARLMVVPNAFDPDVLPTAEEVAEEHRRRREKEQPACCRFLFLALVREIKGVGDLIEAARLLRDAGTRFELHIAGPATDGDEQRWLQQTRDAALEGIVKFVGPVSGREKARQLAAADVFVHPSHSEGLPNSVLEGGAAGLPVIATTVGAVPEVYYPPDLREAGEELPLGPIVAPRDPRALAREMQRLAEDPELRRRIGRRMSRRFNAEYSIDRLAERIAPIYRELLGQSAAEKRRNDNERIVRRVNAATAACQAARRSAQKLCEMNNAEKQPAPAQRG